MLKIGDRVRLMSGKYKPTPFNPVIGTNVECEGTVFSTVAALTVRWDNDKTNTYMAEDLVITSFHKELETANPNLVFRMLKRNKRR